MEKMKLYYFNLRGRAELARLILAQGGADYEDKRIEREDWPKIKPSKTILLKLNQIIISATNFLYHNNNIISH